MTRLLGLLLLCACTGSPDSGRSVEEIFEHYRIASSPGSLSVPGESISDEDLAAILSDPRTPDLTSLELSDNQLGKTGLEHILRSEKTESLRFLNLANNRLDDESIRLLAESPKMATVEYLLLAGNRLSKESARSLSESPHLARLRTLSIGGQDLGEESAVHLSTLGPLQTLDLSSAGLTATGASLLLEKTQAQELLLAKNPLSKGDFSFLKFSDHLIHLDLRGCGLSDRQFNSLRDVTPGAALETMNLSQNPMKDSGVAALGAVKWLTALKKLEAYESQSSLEARTALRESWGQRGGLKVETR